MTERDLTRVLHERVQDVHLSDEARRAIRLAAKEERPVKMKKFVAIALAIVLALSTTVAVAAELGMFDFLARIRGQEVLPGANDLLKTDMASAETEHATFHVKQAAYDGKSAAIMVKITPKSDNILLLDETWSPEEDLMAWLMPELGDSTQTIAEYAAEKGMTIIYAIMRQNPMNECAVIDDWSNGTLTLLRSFNTEEKTLPLTFTFTTFPYMPDGTYLPSSTTTQITLTASEPLWTVSCEETFDLPDYGVRIDGVTVTGTVLQSYWELRYTITDVEKASMFFTPSMLSANGEQLPRGVLGVGGHPNATAVGEQLTAHGGFGAMTEAPGQLTLQVRDVSAATENVFLTINLH